MDSGQETVWLDIQNFGKWTGMMDLITEAINRIESLLAEARASQLREPTAMSLATVDEHGRPSVRTVLLKHLDENGAVFFTNILSRKGAHLRTVPYASICIYFQNAHQQVQLDGKVSAVSDEEADRYWQTRPRASQIGAWASRQSEVLENRQQLYDRVTHYESEFSGGDVPRPDFWSGYRVTPERIEFWSGDTDRLNLREQYLQTSGAWEKMLLYP
jgi:pyridoxamine 5'-phosphate oxidase